MRRRQVLGLCAAVGATELAGCSDGDTDGTPTLTSTRTATETDPGTGTRAGTATPTATDTTTEPFSGTAATIDYSVTNDDDTTHGVEVTLTSADGSVVGRTERSLAAGERLSGRSSGNDPADGPYDLAVALPATSVSVEWRASECTDFLVGVSVTPDATLSVDRETCQN